MSLINDALKRANEQKAKQVSAGELGSSMQVVDNTAEETRLWPIALFAVLLVGALWLGWSGLHSRSNSPDEVIARAPDPTSSSAVAAASEAPTKGSPSSEIPAALEQPRVAAAIPAAPRVTLNPESVTPPPKSVVAAKSDTPIASASPVPVPVPAPPPAPAAPPIPAATPAPNSFPQLSLQGIYYRPSRPSAVINSKTVFVGDKVQQVKVLAIDRYEVTVQWNNEVRVLAFQ